MNDVYTIGEVEKITGISKDRLRNYEKNKILMPGKENDNQYRKYSEKDIIDILGVEHFRMMDLSIKEIRTIHEEDDMKCIYNLIRNKKSAIKEEMNRLNNIIKMLDNTENSCQKIMNDIGKYSIRKMPPFRVLGTLSETNAFSEYEYFRECKNQDTPILKSMLRKIEFTTSEIVSNKVFIIEDSSELNEETYYYEKCVYTIAVEKVNGKDVMEEFFIKTMKYLQDNNHEFQGIAFIKPMLVNYSLKDTFTHIEIFVPIK